jgi:uncharacterized cupin superfamily protein
MDTRLLNIADVPVRRGLPAEVRNPIRPEWFAGRHVAQLTKLAGLTQFGVNVVTLDPGAQSSLRHWHEEEDEFVYVLSGTLTLIDENGEHEMRAGSFAGFPAGAANAHHLWNKSDASATFIAAGTRKVGKETVHYPDTQEMPIGIVMRDAGGDRV